MPKTQKVPFIPFHALNQFMRNDFRLQVVRSTLFALPNLPKKMRAAVDAQTRRSVKVPGFRNSAKAPAALKARSMSEVFEKNPELVAVILSAWAETKADLRKQVFELMEARDWELLPIEADRTKLPGFLTKWPAGEDFETINQAFEEMYPQENAESDEVSLMAVWLSGRLPVEAEEESGPTAE